MKTLKKSLLAALLLSFVALLSVGCGDSNNNNSFVATGNNGANVGTAAVNFQFVQARTTNVPTGTTDLLFEFRDAGNVIVFLTTVSFATDITINDVPADATQVEITALQNGFPVGSVTSPISLTSGQTIEVDLTNATNAAITFDSLTASPASIAFVDGGTQTLGVAATFSDSSSVTVPNSAVTFFSNNTSIANVSPAGVVSGAANTIGNTTIDVSWPFNNVTRSTSVTVTSSATADT